MRNMKINKNYSVSGIILIVTILFSLFALYPTFSTVALAQLDTYDYVVFTNATMTYAKDGVTGEIVYQNSNATALFASIPQGTSWYIEAGTYLGVISINQSQTSVTGSGIDSTTIMCPSGVYRNCIQAVGTDESLLTDIYIGNLTVNGQWDNGITNPPVEPCAYPNELQQNGISLQYVINATAENVKAYNTPWNGIQAFSCQYVNYKYCIADTCHWHGLQFWESTIHSTMDNCSVNNAGGGITSEFGSNDNSITNVVVSNIGFGGWVEGGASGINIGYGVHNIEISNVQVYNSSFGITFFGYGDLTVYNVTLDHAQVDNCTEGLYFDSVTDRISVSNSIVSNSISNNLYSVSSSNVTLFNCTFINSGIYLDENSNYWDIINCTFQNSPISNYGIGTVILTQSMYPLTMYTVGQGSVIPGNQTFAAGAVVDIKAINALGWTFAGWSEGASGSINTTVTMYGPVTVTATFIQEQYIFSDDFESGNLDAWTWSSGDITVQDVIKYEENYAMSYTTMTNEFAAKDVGARGVLYMRCYVYAASSPAAWNAYSFICIRDANYGTGLDAIIYNYGGTLRFGLSCSEWLISDTVLSTEHWYCVEVFRTSGNGDGIATLYVDGVEVLSNNAQTFNDARYVYAGAIYSAVPCTAYIDCVVVADTYIGPMPPPTSVYTLNVTAVGSGSVSLNNTGAYSLGDVVQLTAVPSAGWSFSGWSGDLSGSVNPTIITIDANKTVTATFAQNTYTVTVSVIGQGSVTRNASEPYTYGQVVNLTAVPQSGWVFTGWSGDLSGSANPATLVMTTNKTVTATFAQNTSAPVTTFLKIDSNCTITEMQYTKVNATFYTLNITVLKVDTVQIQVTINKNTLPSISYLQLYINNVQSEFTYIDAGDSWIISVITE